MYMTNQRHSSQPPDVLDELVERLLACGGVLSQMISDMVQFSESPYAVHDTAPIPEVAHTLIRSVLDGVRKQHSTRDITVAARIVEQATNAIAEEIHTVPLTSFEALYRSTPE
jgi:hypothetical protein